MPTAYIKVSQGTVYDPATDAWTQGPNLPVPAQAPSVAVHNNKLYVFGGSTSDPGTGGDLDDVQVYDPALGWTTLPDMPANRSWSMAVTYNAGIYVMGGFDVNNTAVAFNELVR